MALKTYKASLLGRDCISTIIETPHKGEYIYVPKEGEVIEQVSISEVNNHPELITVALIISHNVKPTSC